MKIIPPKHILYYWIKVWQVPAFKVQATVTALVLLTLAFFVNRFFDYIQSRPGHQMDDPVLDHLPPCDMSVYIFVLIYGSILLGVIHLVRFPVSLLKVAQSYCLLVLLRLCTLFLIPLEPARLIIPLRDPFIDRFFYGDNLITKDLFFSGHVATVFLFVLAVSDQILKYFLLVIMVMVALLLLIQHVHYTIDILAAPLFSWISYKAAHILIIKRADN